MYRAEHATRAMPEAKADRTEAAHAQLAKLRHAHKVAGAALARLLAVVEKGNTDAWDAALRERVAGLRFQRDELVRDVVEHEKRITPRTPALTPEQVEAPGNLLRENIF